VQVTAAHLLVVSADGRAILNVDDAVRPGLPVVTVRSRTSRPTFARLLARVRATFAVDLPILDVYPANDPPEELVREVLVTAGPPPPSWVPPPGIRWSSVRAADYATPPVLSGRLRTLLDELRAGRAPPPLRVPWARLGWHERAVAWIEERLAAIDRPRSGLIQLLRTWSLSQVMRIPTDAGPVYFKAVAPHPFGHEAALTAYLARSIPAHAPVVLAFDPAQGWMLTEDFGGRQLEETDPDDLELGLPAIIEIQRALAGKTRELAAVGCLDRPLERLSRDLAVALDGARGMGVPLERATVDRIDGWVRRAAERLDRVGLPPTLVHGDLHPGNVVAVDGRIVVFDWAEGVVANPMLDLYSWLRSAREPGLRQRLREVCAQGWGGVADPDLIRTAFEDAALLSLAHQTVLWMLYLQATEPELRTRWIDPLAGRIQQLAQAAGP
jgi:Phosphotransferase enzyme family